MTFSLPLLANSWAACSYCLSIFCVTLYGIVSSARKVAEVIWFAEKFMRDSRVTGMLSSV